MFLTSALDPVNSPMGSDAPFFLAYLARRGYEVKREGWCRRPWLIAHATSILKEKAN